MNSWIPPSMLLSVFIASLFPPAAGAGEPAGGEAADPVREAIDRLGDESPLERQRAAEALADLVDERVFQAVSDRLKAEKHFHVRLALHFALARRGAWEALLALRDSLDTGGHPGVLYLEEATGKRFLWERDLWDEWLSRMGPEKFRARARQRLEGALKKKVWLEFDRLYRKRAFAEFDGGKTGRMSEEELALLESMPDAKAWALFRRGVTSLQSLGDRRAAEKDFRTVADDFSQTYYAEDAAELADLLKTMVREDEAWCEPAKPSKLDQGARIAWCVHHLRDVVAYQFSQPGDIRVIRWTSGEPDAANSLRKIGLPAVPALLGLLEDRRPLRAVWQWRDFCPELTVLRYQDAALQLLLEILPVEFPMTRRGYLSPLDPEDREKIAADYRSWWEANGSKNSDERLMASVDQSGIHGALEALRELSGRPSFGEKVLDKLREMYGRRHWVYAPKIAELMAELGDDSMVEEVLRLHREGMYRKYAIILPDDGAASSNAEEAAERLANKYHKKDKNR